MLSEFGESLASVTDRSDKHNSAFDDEMVRKISRISLEMRDLFVDAAHQPRLNLIDFTPLNQAFLHLSESLKRQPTKLTGVQADLLRRIMGVVQEIIEQTPAENLDASSRYRDTSWRDSPFFDMSRRLHAAIAGWLHDLPETTPGLSREEVRTLQFWTRQFSAATSPANNVITNPRAMKQLMETHGASLEKSLASLAQASNPETGQFHLRQTDMSAFTVGENIATTPGKVVFKNALIELIAYHPTTDTVRTNPVLFLPPWINKYYVLDLQKDNSLVAWLRDQGLCVYMISWRSGCGETAHMDWNDYIQHGALAAIEHIQQHHQAPINAVGYCAGGTLLSTLVAWMGRHNKTDNLASVTFLAAQTDFEDPGDLAVMLTPRSVDLLEAEIAQSGGLMRGEIMADTFNLLRPEDLIWRYVEENFLLGLDPPPFDLLYWNADQTHIPGPLHLTNLRKLYLENAFSEGNFEVLGDAVGISDIKHPTFVQATERDHLSPAESVYRGARKIKSSKEFVLAESGHIAGVVNPPSANKYGYWTGGKDLTSPNARIWAALGSHHTGSWWTHWLDWLDPFLGDDVPPIFYSDDLPDAPGDYVSVLIRHDQTA